MEKITKDCLKKYDLNDFLGMLKSFPSQIVNTVENDDFINDFIQPKSNIRKILICGMGGSAVGGDLLNSLISNKNYDKCPPIYVNRDYSVPGWVDSNTLVIFSSYSGNTEEVLKCFEKCKNKSVISFIITSGGKLLEIALQYKIPYSLIPKDFMPRQALGFSITILLKFLNKINLIDQVLVDEVYESTKYLKEQADCFSDLNTSNESLEMASRIYNKFNIIYTSFKMEVVGSRFRAQLAENAKILSTHFTFPEQNHNEIEAFENLHVNNFNIIWINDSGNDPKISKRMNITNELLNNIEHVKVSYNDFNYTTRILKLINLLDWVSYYASIMNKTNPYPVNTITKLKKLL